MITTEKQQPSRPTWFAPNRIGPGLWSKRSLKTMKETGTFMSRRLTHGQHRAIGELGAQHGGHMSRGSAPVCSVALIHMDGHAICGSIFNGGGLFFLLFLNPRSEDPYMVEIRVYKRTQSYAHKCCFCKTHT